MIPVLHESQHLLVVRKPSGLSTTAPRGADSLTERLERQQRQRLHPTSRLDAEVTGLVTYARTKLGIAALKDARERGAYHREYVALASARPDADEGAWDASIAMHPRDRRLRVAVPEGGRGERLQTARTRWRVTETRAHATWLTLFPETGRTHQLRVHAAHAGLPLLGDHRYGGPKRVTLDDGRVVRAARVMLHCHRVRVPNAEGGEVDLVDPPPADFVALWEALG